MSLHNSYVFQYQDSEIENLSHFSDFRGILVGPVKTDME